MAIESGPGEDEDQKAAGRYLYDVLGDHVRQLGASHQLGLAMAIQRGTPWELLLPEQQRALAKAAEDLSL